MEFIEVSKDVFKIVMSEEDQAEFDAIWEAEKHLWCTCPEDSDHNSSYHPDVRANDGTRLEKHHWTCNHCNKITQIG